MDKIKKFLKKLSKKELQKVLKILDLIESGNTDRLDIKRLTGHKNIFRVRVGDIRIIFIQSKIDYRLISIGRSSDTTYNL